MLQQDLLQICRSVRREAEPVVVKLFADLVVFGSAALCLAIMLVISWGLLNLCDHLFDESEYHVKIICIFGEIFLTLYIIRFNHRSPDN